MYNYIELANNIAYNGESFNGFMNICDAIQEVDSTFSAENFGRQSYIAATIGNILIDMRGSRNLSKYVTIENNDLDNIFDDTIKLEQFSPHNFDYYQCSIDPISLEAEIVDDFGEVMTSINIQEVILHSDIQIPLAVLIKQLLLAKNMISQYDVIEIDTEEVN